MTAQPPAYYRARINTIRQLIQEIPGSDEKNNDHVLLRNGFIPPALSEKFEKMLEARLQRQVDHVPLSFTEKCSFNTWFAMHPEKIAGIEFVTTSREFPIMVKGTRDDILQAIGSGLQDNKDKRIRIIKAQATAKLKMLELARLDGTGEQIKISVRDAKRWVKEGDMFFVVRSWFKEGHIKNRIYEPNNDPYTKYIETGNGSLILDLDNYTLSWQE